VVYPSIASRCYSNGKSHENEDQFLVCYSVSATSSLHQYLSLSDDHPSRGAKMSEPIDILPHFYRKGIFKATNCPFHHTRVNLLFHSPTLFAICYVSGRGEHERRIKRGSKGGGLPGSITTRRGASLDETDAGKDEERRERDASQGIEGGTKSIFRLRYQIASYTGYIGNLAPSPKHETNTTTDGSAQGEPGYMCNDETRTGTCDSGRRESIGGE
jgi:hypothetical protein